MNIKLHVVISTLCTGCSTHKHIAIYTLYAVGIQTSAAIFVIRRDLVQMKRVKCVVSGGTAYSLRTAPWSRNTK